MLAELLIMTDYDIVSLARVVFALCLQSSMGDGCLCSIEKISESSKHKRGWHWHNRTKHQFIGNTEEPSYTEHRMGLVVLDHSGLSQMTTASSYFWSVVIVITMRMR